MLETMAVVAMIGIIMSAFISSLLFYCVNKKILKDNGVKYKNVLLKDFVSTVVTVFLMVGILLIFFERVFISENYLLTVFLFLLSYLLIDVSQYKKWNVDSSDLFLITMVCKIPTILVSFLGVYNAIVPALVNL